MNKSCCFFSFLFSFPSVVLQFGSDNLRTDLLCFSCSSSSFSLLLSSPFFVECVYIVAARNCHRRRPKHCIPAPNSPAAPISSLHSHSHMASRIDPSIDRSIGRSVDPFDWLKYSVWNRSAVAAARSVHQRVKVPIKVCYKLSEKFHHTPFKSQKHLQNAMKTFAQNKL